MSTLHQFEQCVMDNSKVCNVDITEFQKRSNSMLDLMIFNQVQAGRNTLDAIAKALRIKVEVLAGKINNTLFLVSDGLVSITA